jgi:hypothetical protein
MLYINELSVIAEESDDEDVAATMPSSGDEKPEPYPQLDSLEQ